MKHAEVVLYNFGWKKSTPCIAMRKGQLQKPVNMCVWLDTQCYLGHLCIIVEYPCKDLLQIVELWIMPILTSSWITIHMFPCMQILSMVHVKNMEFPILNATCLELETNLNKCELPGITCILKNSPRIQILVINYSLRNTHAVCMQCFYLWVYIFHILSIWWITISFHSISGATTRMY